MQIIFVEKGFSASAKLIHCSHELAHLFAPITKSFYLESKKNLQLFVVSGIYIMTCINIKAVSPGLMFPNKPESDVSFIHDIDSLSYVDNL